MKIDFANLQHQYQLYKSDIDERMQQVLNKSNYIMGNEVAELEYELCQFSGATHAISCSSGTDALLLAMMALDIKPGDEIITTPFTFFATAETIAFLGAKPVFVDIDAETYNIDPAKIEDKITQKTKAIMPVSLYGQPVDLDEINAIANKYALKVIVDGAQSFGSTYKGRQEVHFCDVYTTSFFPAKPLGCFGDGGAVFTHSEELAEKVRMLRVHGQSKRYHHKYVGMGGRLDTLQAAVLLAKLPHYASEIDKRHEIAEQYSILLSSNDVAIRVPVVSSNRTSVFAQYTIYVEDRDLVQAGLKEVGIPTAVHYPVPLHLQECFHYLGYRKGEFPVAEEASQHVMSLPMNAFITSEEIEFICTEILKM